MLSFLIISLIWSVTSIYGIGHCQSLTSRNQSLGGGSCSRRCSSRLDFLGEKIHVMLRHLLGWFVGSTSAINPWNFGVKRPREISEPTGSISFHCLNWTLSMCLPGAVNTAEVEKVGTELRALKEKLKQEAQGKWDALQAQFFDPITLSSGFRYIYILDYKIWYHEYI